MSQKTFVPLFVTNFFGVVNDNFLKTLASFTVIGWLTDESMRSVFVGISAGALVLPYILFSPLADRLTALFSKVRILRLAKWAEIPIIALAVTGFALESMPLVLVSIVLMGFQSSLYSPAKYALIRDIGGESRISTGMGGMEGVSFLAMLGGTVCGSYVADLDLSRPLVKSFCMFGFALGGLLASLTVRADEARNRELHAINPWRYLRRAYRFAKRYDGLNSVIMTLSAFWMAAAMLQIGLLVYGGAVLKLDATHTGCMLALAAVGIVSGQVIAGFVDRRRFLLGATLLTGWIAAVLLLVMRYVPMSPLAFSVVLGLTAFDLGFFKLPLDAEIQKRVKGSRLNTMLAYFNQVSFLFMLAASGIYSVVSWLMGPQAFLSVIALVMFVMPVWFFFRYRSVFCCVGEWVLSRRYDVRINLNSAQIGVMSESPLLVLPNHPAMVDPMLVTAMLRRIPMRPLCDEIFLDRGGLSAAVLKMLGAIRVPDLRKHRTAAGAKIARGLTDVVTDALAEGKSVVFYPSGHIWTEPREEIGTRQLAYNVCRALPERARVIGVRTDGLWGSIWSRKGRDKSPDFAPTLVKSVLLWFACLLTHRRRTVSMQVEDLTDRVREWSALSRLDFNRQLEAWYNQV